jgi:CheY-like chemotaxis protein
MLTPSPPPTVLVVDDNPVCRDVLGILLRGAGYAVQEAADGRQALERLRAGPLPGLILLDLDMPVTDGFAFRAAQLRDSALADIPVVILTGGYGPGDAARLGAVGVLLKPADLDEVLHQVRCFCLGRSTPADRPSPAHALACP